MSIFSSRLHEGSLFAEKYVVGCVAHLTHFSLSALLVLECFDDFVTAFTSWQIAFIHSMILIKTNCTFALVFIIECLHLRVLHALQFPASKDEIVLFCGFLLTTKSAKIFAFV